MKQRKKLNLNAVKYEYQEDVSYTQSESSYVSQEQQPIQSPQNQWQFQSYYPPNYTQQPFYQGRNVNMKTQQVKNSNVTSQNNTKKVKEEQSKATQQITIPEEPKLSLDSKLGYWTYTEKEHLEFKEKVAQFKDLKKKYEENLKEMRMLEQKKRIQKYAALKEKQQRRNNILGLKKINQLIRDLRIQYNKYIRKEKKKQFGFTLDEQNNVQIIEQEKKKKLSKLKRAKQLWDDMQDSSYETVDEEGDNQKDLIKSILTSMALKNPFSQCKYNNMNIRPWITQIPCKEMDDAALLLINELSYMQAKKKVMEPKKFKKRIVAGMKECYRSVQYILSENQSKLIIIPINIQEYPIKNGPDHEILKILKACQQRNIPVIFASNRSKLARAFSGKFGAKISVISIINYQNAEEQFNQLLQLREKQILEFKNKFGDRDLSEYYNQIQ